jgi:alkaline phosphatase D
MLKNILLFLFITSIICKAQLHSGPFAGAVTTNAAQFIVKTYSEQTVKIELFSETEVDKSIYSIEQTALDTNYNYVKLPMFDLKPNTTYYYRAIVDNIPSKRWHQFKTFPAEKNTNFSFGFGSCQQSSWRKWDPTIFPIIAQDTLRFFIHIGDWTYPDTTEKKYGYRFNTKMDLIEKSYQSRYNYNYPFASEVLSQMPIAYVYDDHDFAANNPDGTDPAKANTISAYQMFFPHYNLPNKNNGIWQRFTFGDVEFIMLDIRAQRSPNENAFDKDGKINPPKDHSLLAGFEIEGVNQKDWLKETLKNSKAKWKVIVSSVLFNPGYALALNSDSLISQNKWMPNDIIDKWAGYPNEQKEILDFIKENEIKNILVISGDSHSSYIDDGTNSLLPEISASNLEVSNSMLDQKLKSAGIEVWNRGSYSGEGNAYGRVTFVYDEGEYALLEIVDDKNEVAASYKLMAE